MVLTIRTAGDPTAIASSVRQAVWSVSRNVRITEVATMDQVIGTSLSARRFPMMMLGLFALAALLLAALGLYGVLAYTVAQRTQEIGIRMALGARPRQVLRMILREGILLVGLGVAAGITGALALRSLLAGFLFEVKATDPATLVPIFRQVRIRDRVAQTVMSESAFNDAIGAIITFGILGAATGSGSFSLTSSLLQLLEHSAIGIVAGIVLGYLAALLIAHERWAFLAEYAPVVTVIAVIGAYFAADGLHASGFMAVFVFGIMLGNKETFGFRMEPGEAQKLDEFVLTTGVADDGLSTAAAGRSPRDTFRFEQDDTITAFRQMQRCRAACNPAADHAHIGVDIPSQRWVCRCWIGRCSVVGVDMGSGHVQM